ncbi:MAG: hypothetical protein JSV09_08305 [Thermoplasmata archaeon]|nr:MAG: hypothetical protein JSV09_08305 [Thermoplasmata archaeon]
MLKEDETFTFETIAQVFREERNSTILTKLPIHFYKQLIDYMERLQESYFEERDNDPISSKTMMLEDELNKAQRRVSQIYEYRERKIVLLALQAANGGVPDLTFITGEEKKVFEALVDLLSDSRSRILLKKDEDVCKPKTFLAPDEKHVEIVAEKESNDKKESQDKETIKGKEKEESVTNNMTNNFDQENSVLLILEDIPSFETEERTFNLKKDDTITLSKKLAKILCKHEKARIIEG